MPRISLALRNAACFCALACALSGCTGLPQASSLASAQRQAASARDAASNDLLYVGAKKSIEVYTYPGGVYNDTITTPGSVQSMCSDAQGNVFLAAMSRQKGSGPTGNVYEYEHGGNSPISTLDLPRHEIPVNCSSDPTTGNLAVTSYDVRNFAPRVEIYANAGGKPQVLRNDALGANPQPAYDGHGNLFVTSGGNLAAVLPKGKQSLQEIRLNRTLGGVAHAQWDGKYFALQSFQPTRHPLEHTLVRVYRVKVSGSSGTIVGFSEFAKWRLKEAGQSWIQRGTLVATPQSDTRFFKYPAGGNPFMIITHATSMPAVTVSIAR